MIGLSKSKNENLLLYLDHIDFNNLSNEDRKNVEKAIAYYQKSLNRQSNILKQEQTKLDALKREKETLEMQLETLPQQLEKAKAEYETFAEKVEAHKEKELLQLKKQPKKIRRCIISILIITVVSISASVLFYKFVIVSQKEDSYAAELKKIEDSIETYKKEIERLSEE